METIIKDGFRYLLISEYELEEMEKHCQGDFDYAISKGSQMKAKGKRQVVTYLLSCLQNESTSDCF